jgi:D-sedoheptulose 7-phosphate isomerase
MDNKVAWLKESIQDSIATKAKMLEDEQFILNVLEVAEVITAAFKRGNRVIFAGNGGSAADAQHLAAEFVSRFEFDRPGLPSLSLATDTSMITAIGNDYGYDKLFVRQLQAQHRKGDIFVGISTSGKSPNVIEALKVCSDLGVVAISMCGLSGNMNIYSDHIIRVPSTSTPRIQESHILIGHMLCAYVENSLFSQFKK